MKILVCMPVTETHKEWLAQAAGADELLFCEQSELPADFLAEADIVIGNPSLDDLKDAKKLKLLQLNSAGTGNYTRLPEICPGAMLCCATGSYGLAISEHMLGVLLMMMKKLALYRDQQFAGKWDSLGFVDSIDGANALVLGMGDIGSALAMRLHALGAHVTGIRRTVGEKPDYCEAVYTIDHLDELLPKADIVAMSMPETDLTRGMMNEKRFAEMKQGAYLVNVGRGSAVDQDALLAALQSGHIAGAALDVTSPEPLPPEHPLWQQPNCVITPHISGGYRLPETHNRIMRLACRNIAAVREGHTPESLVDFETGYRKR